VTDASSNNLIANFSHTGSRLWMCLLQGNNQISVSSGTATFRWNDSYV
jgi:hypothetical protein